MDGVQRRPRQPLSHERHGHAGAAAAAAARQTTARRRVGIRDRLSAASALPSRERPQSARRCLREAPLPLPPVWRDPLDRLVGLRVDRRDCDHAPPQLLGGLEIAFLSRPAVRRASAGRGLTISPVWAAGLDAVSRSVRRACTASDAAFYSGDTIPAHGTADADPDARPWRNFLPLQTQSFEQAIGKGAVL